MPARFREQLETAYLTSESSQCLALWPPEDFAARAKELRDAARRDQVSNDRAAYFFAGAQEVTPDKQGRIAIPPALREFAELTLSAPVVVTGFLDHVEIRPSAAWQEKKVRGAEAMASMQFQPSAPASRAGDENG